MADNETARLKAVAEQEEPIFVFVMSSIKRALSSRKTDWASSNETPCLTRLDRALRRSQANSILPTALY